AAKKATAWFGSRSARSGDRARLRRARTPADGRNHRSERSPSGLEMHHDSSGKLEIVLGLAEKSGADVIGFQPTRKAGIEAVVRATTRLDAVGVATVPGNLRLFMSSAKDAVHPRFPVLSPPSDLRPAPVDHQLHVFAVENFRGKRHRDISFERKPVV